MLEPKVANVDLSLSLVASGRGHALTKAVELARNSLGVEHVYPISAAIADGKLKLQFVEAIKTK